MRTEPWACLYWCMALAMAGGRAVTVQLDGFSIVVGGGKWRAPC